MMHRYSLVFSEAAAEVVIHLPKRKRALLLEELRNLAHNPSIHSDYRLPDVSGRLIDYGLLGDFLIAYWTDEPVRELRILHVEAVS